jgi:hypothetical protein
MAASGKREAWCKDWRMKHPASLVELRRKREGLDLAQGREGRINV